MIRKLFTAGRDITVVETSAFAGIGAILKSIQAVLPEMSLAVEETGFAEKLPTRVFWSDLANRRLIQRKLRVARWRHK